MNEEPVQVLRDRYQIELEPWQEALIQWLMNRGA